MEHAENKMGTKSMLPLLAGMSFPPMISMMIQSLYNVVDSIFVARLGTEALTAVSLAFPIQNLILSLAVGTGVGINSYVARKLGERNQKEADSAAAHGLVLALFHYIAFAILAMFFIKPFFTLFTDDPLVMAMGCDYTYIVSALAFGTIVHISIEKILQATGNMFFPMMLQIAGAIVNIALDPLLIYGLYGFPQMGVRGAAVATVAGQIVAMSCSIVVLFYRKHQVSVSFRGFRFQPQMARQIYSTGIPAFFINSIGSFSVMGINMILTPLSHLAVSVYGIYFKLQTFIYMPTNGITQGAMPIMGYSYGARNRKRLKSVLNYSLLGTALVSLGGTLLFCSAPVPILKVFNAAGEMMDMGVMALRIISTSYLLGSVCFVYSCLFQAIGKGLPSLLITVLRQFALLIPMAWLLSISLGLSGVWIAFPITDAIMCLFTILLFKRYEKRDDVLQYGGREEQGNSQTFDI